MTMVMLYVRTIDLRQKMNLCMWNQMETIIPLNLENRGLLNQVQKPPTGLWSTITTLSK